jgi:broad specificity phosphatase PhoE
VRALVSSPLRRARETAQKSWHRGPCLPVEEDARLRERMNWGGSERIEEFLADWAASVKDRDFVPASGDSSCAAAKRMGACVADLAQEPGLLALVTHGSATVDLLRTLIGDHAVPSELMHQGVPACAITMLDDLSVIEIASVSHLE